MCARGCACALFNRLDISGNKLTDACMLALSEALRSAPLSQLNLAHNSFTKVGVGALAGALATSKLTKLEIYACGLKDDSIEVLAPALFKAPLQKLDVKNNSNLSNSGKSQLKVAWTQAGKSDLNLTM